MLESCYCRKNHSFSYLTKRVSIAMFSIGPPTGTASIFDINFPFQNKLRTVIQTLHNFIDT